MFWTSFKCQRDKRYTLAVEVHAFSISYNYDMSLCMLPYQMKVHVPLYTFTDTKSILDTITISESLHELWLINDVADIWRAYKESETSNTT